MYTELLQKNIDGLFYILPELKSLKAVLHYECIFKRWNSWFFETDVEFDIVQGDLDVDQLLSVRPNLLFDDRLFEFGLVAQNDSARKFAEDIELKKMPGNMLIWWRLTPLDEQWSWHGLSPRLSTS